MPRLAQPSLFWRRATQARGFLATLLFMFLSISQVSSQPMPAELLEELQAKERIVQTDATGALQPMESVRLERLASDPKMLNTQAILAPFARGEAETAVIVTLEPTATALNLADQSVGSHNRQESFDQGATPSSTISRIRPSVPSCVTL